MSTTTRHSRESVIQAAGKLFALRGYHGTSMQDLGNELGLFKSSIYSHVSSKEDLLLEVVRRAERRRAERLFNQSAQRAMENNVGEAARLQALITGHLQVILDHRDEASTFLNEARALDARYREAVIAARDGNSPLGEKRVDGPRSSNPCFLLRIHEELLAAPIARMRARLVRGSAY